jgi:hypothetical protein
MKLTKVNDVYQINDEYVQYLNNLSSVQDFPDKLNPPTLSKKITIITRAKTGGRSAVANSKIFKGEIICANDSAKINKPINYSWQLAENAHTIGPGALDHNCQSPTCSLDENNNFNVSKYIKSLI